MEFAHERIKAARTAKRMTQGQVASCLGISQPAYAQMENGSRPDMRISTLRKLCLILEVSADWVLGLRTKD